MMNKNLTSNINEEELESTAGGATRRYSRPKYSAGDVVEVGFALNSKGTNRGKISQFKLDGNTWKYYIRYYDKSIPNGWVPEGQIVSKVR